MSEVTENTSNESKWVPPPNNSICLSKLDTIFYNIYSGLSLYTDVFKKLLEKANDIKNITRFNPKLSPFNAFWSGYALSVIARFTGRVHLLHTFSISTFGTGVLDLMEEASNIIATKLAILRRLYFTYRQRPFDTIEIFINENRSNPFSLKSCLDEIHRNLTTFEECICIAPEICYKLDEKSLLPYHTLLYMSLLGTPSANFDPLMVFMDNVTFTRKIHPYAPFYVYKLGVIGSLFQLVNAFYLWERESVTNLYDDIYREMDSKYIRLGLVYNVGRVLSEIPVTRWETKLASTLIIPILWMLPVTYFVSYRLCDDNTYYYGCLPCIPEFYGFGFSEAILNAVSFLVNGKTLLQEFQLMFNALGRRFVQFLVDDTLPFFGIDVEALKLELKGADSTTLSDSIWALFEYIGLVNKFPLSIEPAIQKFQDIELRLGQETNTVS